MHKQPIWYVLVMLILFGLTEGLIFAEFSKLKIISLLKLGKSQIFKRCVNGFGFGALFAMKTQ
jgi:hypothetical protein